MAFCTLCALASRGGICLNSTARGQSITASIAGQRPGFGTSKLSWILTTIRHGGFQRRYRVLLKLKKTDKRRCLGRSRGGLGTKIHASNNQDGLPLKLELTPNQANDAPPCGTLLTGLQPGQWVLADKAYDVNWIRNMIWEQGAIDVIPSKSNRKIPKEFDKVMYRQRNKIERFFGRLKASFRRIATRYEHTSANFLAMIKLACVRLWLEFYEYAA